MNEPDAYALEEALRLKEKHGGEVVVCSAGPARVAQVHPRGAGARRRSRHSRRGRRRWRSADAFVGRRRAGRRRWRTSEFDLVLTGLQSDDQGFAQTGVILAERLGLPHATIVMEVQCASRAGAAAREARARGRLVPVGGDAAAGGADDPERHQPAALRDAQGHHGGEEERDRKVAARGRRGAAARRSSASTLPEKTKKTQMITDRRPRPPASWCARSGTTPASFR